MSGCVTTHIRTDRDLPWSLKDPREEETKNVPLRGQSHDVTKSSQLVPLVKLANTSPQRKRNGGSEEEGGREEWGEGERERLEFSL